MASPSQAPLVPSRAAWFASLFLFGIAVWGVVTVGPFGDAVGAESARRIYGELTAAQRKAAVDPGLAKFNESFVKLAAKGLPAVVSISTTGFSRARGDMPPNPLDWLLRPQPPGGGQRRVEGMGSGFVISPDGYILTNYHVIEDAARITVHFNDERELTGTVVGRDPLSDVALVKVDSKIPLPTLPLGNSDTLRIGEWVMALGNPLGLEFTVTQGIISQLGRRDIEPSGRQIFSNFIQTDASINPGNSGGPMINLAGEVVGINAAVAQGAGIGFAIPINMVKDILPQLLRDGRVRRSWLGVQIQPVTVEMAQQLGLDRPMGALVAGVVDGSPADRAGILPEDVILSFDGRPIQKHTDLSWMASTAGIGRRIKLEVLRNRNRITLEIELGELPAEGGRSGGGRSVDPRRAPRGDGRGGGGSGGGIMRPRPPTGEEAPPAAEGESDAAILGIVTRPLSPDEARNYGMESGLVVVELDPRGPPASAGLQVGDVILAVNRAAVTTRESLKSLLNRVPSRGYVRMIVYKPEHGSRFIIAFRMP